VGEKETFGPGERTAAGGGAIAIGEEGVQRAAGAIAIEEEGVQRATNLNSSKSNVYRMAQGSEGIAVDEPGVTDN